MLPIVNIRSYRDSDYEDVKKNLQDGQMFEPDWDSRDILKLKITAHPGTILVAEVDEQAVGNVYIINDPWFAGIFRLAVRKEYRGRDLGRLLMEQAEKDLKERGHKEIMLIAQGDRDKLITWYEQQGYQFAPGKSYRCMWKSL